MAVPAGFFPNANNFEINNANFIDQSNVVKVTNVNNHNHVTDSKGLDSLYPFIATGATHDAAERGDPPKCHENTRVALLKRIASFFRDRTPDLTARLLCVIAPAGGGKTALLQTSSERGKKEGTLAASFFFWSTANQRNNKDRLVITIAYQLAISIPFLRPYIIAAYHQDELITGKNVESQMHVLLVEPTRLALQAPNCKPHTWPRGISIDGLDECKGDINQADILRSLSKTLLNPHNRFPFSILLASRPEVAIRNALDSILKNDRVLRLDLDHSHRPDLDIRVFMQCEFDAIKKRDPGLRDSSTPWPTQQVYDQLVQNASGQFIYPSVVIKFVGETGGNPDKRLQMVLQVKALTTQSKNPLAILDGLYTSIITRAQQQLEVRSEDAIVDPLQTVKMLRYISSVDVIEFPMALSAGNPPDGPASERRRDLRFVALMYLTVEEELLDKKRVQLLDKLLRLDPGTTERSLVDVHSLVDVSTLGFYHRSFLDFLDDQKRCANLHVPSSSIHEYIINSCLVHLASLDDEEICAVAATVFKTVYPKHPTQDSYLMPLVRFLKGYEIRRQRVANGGLSWLNSDLVRVATAFVTEAVSPYSRHRERDRYFTPPSPYDQLPVVVPYTPSPVVPHVPYMPSPAPASSIRLPQHSYPRPSVTYIPPRGPSPILPNHSDNPWEIPSISLPFPHDPPSRLNTPSPHPYIPSREHSSHSRSHTAYQPSLIPSPQLIPNASQSVPHMWRSVKYKLLTIADGIVTGPASIQYDRGEVARLQNEIRQMKTSANPPPVRIGRSVSRPRRSYTTRKPPVPAPPVSRSVGASKPPEVPKKRGFWAKVGALFKPSRANPGPVRSRSLPPIPPVRRTNVRALHRSSSSSLIGPHSSSLIANVPPLDLSIPDFDKTFVHMDEGFKGTWDPLEYVEWKYDNVEIPSKTLVDVIGEVKSIKEMGRSLKSLPEASKKFILKTLQTLLEIPELMEESGHRNLRKTILHLFSVTVKHWAGSVDLSDIKFDDTPIREHVGRGFKAKLNQQLLDLCIPTRQVHVDVALAWGHLEHDNIYPFYGLFKMQGGGRGRGRTCYVWPWPQGCVSLKEYLKYNPTAKKSLLLRDVLCGLEYLHDLGIVVSTLTAATVVVTQSGRACIKNFGPNFPARNRTKIKEIVKHDYYLQAPEIYSGKNYTFVNTKDYDVYSFGCLCFEILSGYDPIQPNPIGKASDIVYLKFKTEESGKALEEGCDSLWSLIEECHGWNQASEPARPTVTELLSNPAFANSTTPDDRPCNDWAKTVTPSPAEFRAAVQLAHNDRGLPSIAIPMPAMMPMPTTIVMPPTMPMTGMPMIVHSPSSSSSGSTFSSRTSGDSRRSRRSRSRSSRSSSEESPRRPVSPIAVVPPNEPELW